MSYIKELISELELNLQQLPLEKEPKNLYDPIRYTLSLGGKRLRPLLTLLGYQLFKEDYQKVIQPALAIEVFHNFTLVHDDIMDQAPTRRGKPSVYKKWDENIAILSGDVMQVEAYKLLTGIDTNHLAEVINLFSTCASDVCEGQQYDMDFEERDDVSEAEYIEMIRLKTAVLVGFALQLGAIVAGTDQQQADLLREFGEQVGIGFQLKDDLLDVYGDQEKFGKQVGGDIISNKKTFLLINALQKANPAQKEELENWISKTTFDAEEKVKAVTRIYNEIGIKELTEQKINEYFDNGFKQLEIVSCNSNSAKEVLKQFVEQLIERES
ncbi:MAG: polyprenyl synthetase family protein [Cyclobacteriaceae bacterium]